MILSYRYRLLSWRCRVLRQVHSTRLRGGALGVVPRYARASGITSGSLLNVGPRASCPSGTSPAWRPGPRSVGCPRLRRDREHGLRPAATPVCVPARGRAGGVDPRQRSGRVRSQLRWSARPSDQRPPHRLPSPYATGPTPRPARARSPPPSRSAGAIRLLRDRLMDDEASAFAVRREPSSASSAWVWASWIRPVVGAGERGT